MSGLVVALNVVNYTLLSYMPTYLQRRLGLTTDAALIVPIIGMVFMMVLVPFAGALSDKVGRKPMWWFSLIGLFVGAMPLYLLMDQGAGRSDYRLRRPGPPLCPPARDDFRDLPRNVPDACALRRLRDRL